MDRKALSRPFFTAPPPKSLDRNDFATLNVDGMSTEDGAATLTAFTAASIAVIAPMLPKVPANWIVVGGGASNPTLWRCWRASGTRRRDARQRSRVVRGCH